MDGWKEGTWREWREKLKNELLVERELRNEETCKLTDCAMKPRRDHFTNETFIKKILSTRVWVKTPGRTKTQQRF